MTISPIMEVIDAAGVDVKLRPSADEINICCPFCPDRGESVDARFRLGINTSSGQAHCFNCGWKCIGIGTTKELAKVFRVGYRTQRDAKKPVRIKKVTRPTQDFERLPTEYERLVGALDRIGKKARAYLESREVTLSQIIRHKIGFAAVGSMAWRVLFPLLDKDGVVRGCVGRAFAADMQPKYLGTKTAKVLWNGCAADDQSTAVVSEGILDALRVETALLSERGMVSVARLGSTITEGQLTQLKEFKHVIVLPDWDEAGVKGAIDICEKASARGINVSVSIPGKMDGRDPGSMEPDQILEFVRAAQSWGTPAKVRLRCAAKRR